MVLRRSRDPSREVFFPFPLIPYSLSRSSTLLSSVSPFSELLSHRTNFYITDTGPHKYRIFYYRHCVWSRIEKISVDALKKKQLRALTHSEAKLILSRDERLLGAAAMRLLPKPHVL